ncbi:hypothetical protein CCACVL1_11414, partial [Corchorus capsularis]
VCATMRGLTKAKHVYTFRSCDR